MNVSELARRTGLTPKAIRFYESEGTIPAAPRGANGYRSYSDDDLCRLRVIASLRGMGLSLAESGRLASLCVDDKCDVMATELLPLVRDRRAAVAQQKRELDHLEKELQAVESALKGESAKLNLCAKGGE
jgi:MerR family transcriptional regulator, copper efflux regulator